jgi:hypothetical protein
MKENNTPTGAGETAAQNMLRRFNRAAKKAGAVKIQKSTHGCGKRSAQGFDSAGKLVIDWNL